MIECSGIFSKEIAFDCSESGFAVARAMLFPLHHNADADALIGANEEGTASPAKAASPRSCQQIEQRRGLLLSESGRLGTPISCAIEKPWNLSHAANTAEMRRDADPVAADRVLARLALRRVRPRDHAIVDAGKPSCSALVPRISCVSVSVPNVGSPLILPPGRSVRSVHVPSPDTLHASIETLFTELARRRLRSLVAKENS